MFVETVEELIAAFRSDVDDVVSSDGSDNLWSADDALRYLNAAVDKTAKATLSIHEVLSLPIVASDPVVPLPRRVLHIRSARLASNNLPVIENNLNEEPLGAADDYGLITYGANSQFNRPPGTPKSFIRDYVPRGLYLVPASAADDALIVQCSVTIESPLDDSDDLPFNDTDDIELVLLWMKKLAYSKHDAETYDLDRAQFYEASFVDRARARRAEAENFHRRPGLVRMQW